MQRFGRKGIYWPRYGLCCTFHVVWARTFNLPTCQNKHGHHGRRTVRAVRACAVTSACRTCPRNCQQFVRSLKVTHWIADTTHCVIEPVHGFDPRPARCLSLLGCHSLPGSHASLTPQAVFTSMLEVSCGNVYMSFVSKPCARCEWSIHKADLMVDAERHNNSSTEAASSQQNMVGLMQQDGETCLYSPQVHPHSSRYTCSGNRLGNPVFCQA